MKKSRLIIVFVLCFTAVSGFCHEIKPGVKAQPILINWEIVNSIQRQGEKLNKLKYYISKPFTLITGVKNNAPVVSIVAGEYKERKQDFIEKRIQFTTASEGTLYNFYPVPRGGEIFEVFFPMEKITLKFKRNVREDCFELFGLVFEGENFNVYSERALPRLVIYGITNEMTKETVIQAFPISATIPGTQYLPINDYAPKGQQPVNVRNTPIMGEGRLNLNNIVAYIEGQRIASLSHNQIVELIRVYISEAQRENINHDIAIAQMLYATKNLSDRVLIRNHNYGDLSPFPGWDGKFNEMTLGVRAHIQHLKCYASRYDPIYRIVDPRFDLLKKNGFQGSVTTLYDLSVKWAGQQYALVYENSISGILEKIYRF